MKSKNYCIIRDKSLLTLVDFTTPYYRSVQKRKENTNISYFFVIFAATKH